MLNKVYIYVIIGLLTVLMGVGAIWQHNRYVALNEQFESLVEANKALEEASKKADKAGTVKEDTAVASTKAITRNLQQTQQSLKDLTMAVQKGSQNEKTLMATPLPADVVRVLDAAYEDNDKTGTNP
jgi:N-acetylmuramoyl-L-alanine amidase CwlA